MKKGWKWLQVVLIMAMVAVLTMGCGGADLADSKYVGTWRAASVMGFDPAVVGMEIQLTLEGDGTAVVHIDGEDAAGSWEETEDGILIKDNGDSMACVGDEVALEATIDGVTVIFEKLSEDGAKDNEEAVG